MSHQDHYMGVDIHVEDAMRERRRKLYRSTPTIVVMLVLLGLLAVFVDRFERQEQQKQEHKQEELRKFLEGGKKELKTSVASFRSSPERLRKMREKLKHTFENMQIFIKGHSPDSITHQISKELAALVGLTYVLEKSKAEKGIMLCRLLVTLSMLAPRRKGKLNGKDHSFRDIHSVLTPRFLQILYLRCKKSPNLKNIYLHSVSFRDSNFENVDFSGADLRTNTFVNVNLQGANFKDAQLHNTNYIDVNVTGTLFSANMLPHLGATVAFPACLVSATAMKCFRFHRQETTSRPAGCPKRGQLKGAIIAYESSDISLLKPPQRSGLQRGKCPW